MGAPGARLLQLAGRRHGAHRPTPAEGARRSRLGFAARRFVDLQAGSIWLDLEQLLPGLWGAVADVGCGAQPYRPLIPSDATYIGMDTEDAARDFGYDLSDIRRLDGDRWPADDGELDAVLSTETLEHVANQRGSWARRHAAWAKEGQARAQGTSCCALACVPHGDWRFTPSSLRRLLKGAGTQGRDHLGSRQRADRGLLKVMALLLPMALPQRQAGSVRVSPWALLLGLPILLLALLGHRSLRTTGQEELPWLYGRGDPRRCLTHRGPRPASPQRAPPYVAPRGPHCDSPNPHLQPRWPAGSAASSSISPGVPTSATSARRCRSAEPARGALAVYCAHPAPTIQTGTASCCPRVMPRWRSTRLFTCGASWTSRRSRASLRMEAVSAHIPSMQYLGSISRPARSDTGSQSRQAPPSPGGLAGSERRAFALVSDAECNEGCLREAG